MQHENSFLAHHEALVQEHRWHELRRERDHWRELVRVRESSLSWKLTAPLRSLDAVFGRGGQWRGATRKSPAPFAWTAGLELHRDGVELGIDVSRVLMADYGTGIQRVVRAITRSLLEHYPGQVAALDLRGDDLRDASERFLSGSRATPSPAIRTMQRLLLLDGSWDIHNQIGPLFRACHAAAIPVVTCVYDLIPLDFPETTRGDVAALFRGWIESAAARSDAFVCISETTARRLERFLSSEYRGPRRARHIGWWRLGSELPVAHHTPGAPRFLVPPGLFCLCVGTLEPRKNQRFLLDFFTALWREENIPVSLVFAGRDGWKTDDLVRNIEEHPEFGRRLWWFRGVNDDHLQELYRRAAALIMASSAEGFGLPVVEAARYDKPVVLSDLPVFRDIVVENGYFFPTNDPRGLRSALERALAADAPPTRVRGVSWRESADELRELVVHGKYQLSL